MVRRWRFDDLAGEVYTVPLNPNKMSKVQSSRNIITKVTTAVSGQTLFFEGQRSPEAWSFSGVLLDKDHYFALEHWVYDKGRITIVDHFNRTLSVVLYDFDATPKAAMGKYWKHDYSVKGYLYDVDSTAAINP